MVSEIKEALKDYIKQPLPSNKKKLFKSLWTEIIDALKGRKKYTKYNRKYLFYYESKINKDILPDEVGLFGIKKDFSEVLIELIKDLIKKIDNHEKNSATIIALTRDKKDRKKWIRYTMGLILTNKIFKEEIGSNILYQIETTDKIERAPSGKYQYVISHVKKPGNTST